MHIACRRRRSNSQTTARAIGDYSLCNASSVCSMSIWVISISIYLCLARDRAPQQQQVHSSQPAQSRTSDAHVNMSAQSYSTRKHRHSSSLRRHQTDWERTMQPEGLNWYGLDTESRTLYCVPERSSAANSAVLIRWHRVLYTTWYICRCHTRCHTMDCSLRLDERVDCALRSKPDAQWRTECAVR